MANSTASFSGRVALITGGTSGIGAATVRELAGLGAQVMIAGIEDETGAAMVTELCKQYGEDRVRYCHTDVAKPEQIQAMVSAVEAAWGRLDILVNNAGIGSFSSTPDLAPETWREVMAVNLDSVFHACKAAIPLIQRQGGAIINTASISGLAADYHMGAYAASKAAVINYTRALALDHARDNIRVNAVCPGLIATALTVGALSMDSVREPWVATVPMQRPGQPEEIAKTIRFLASDDASYITGTAIAIDGGMSAWTGQPNMPKLFGMV